MINNIFFLTTIVLLAFIASFSRADEMGCLVEAIYHEARSEPFTAQLSVANVILERVADDRFPNTICKVVHQGKYNRKGQPIRNRCMFSYWCDGKSEKMRETQALKKVIQVAELAAEGVQVGVTLGATHYHANYVQPHWTHSKDFMYVGNMGKHLFYLDIRN
jgi:spore germination cell wall hydrolase CwlJ-like protein